MRCPTLIGVAAATGRGAYTARHLHSGEHPDRLVPLLRQVWQHTHHGDTPAFVGALLACDWVQLDPAPHRRSEPGVRPVPGVGYATGDPDSRPRVGSLLGEAGTGVQWLYLIDPDVRVVTVYEATRSDRWLRHSLHYLHVDEDDDLFTTHPSVHCLTCGGLDLIDYHELPSMTGSGVDASTRCLRCGAGETFDPMFGRHRSPVPWPPPGPGASA